MDPSLEALGLYFIAVLILVAGMVGISALLGERHRERTTENNPAIHRWGGATIRPSPVGTKKCEDRDGIESWETSSVPSGLVALRPLSQR